MGTVRSKQGRNSHGKRYVKKLCNFKSSQISVVREIFKWDAQEDGRQSLKQNEAVSIEQMIALMKLFEDNWETIMKNKLRTFNQVREVLFHALFLVLAFCGAL
jgi:hypothetical protein